MEPRAPDPGERKGSDVSAMFGAIAPTYDLLNHLLSFGADLRWRLAMHRAGRSRVAGADFCLPMLRRAYEKFASKGRGVNLSAADAMALPFRDGAFDAVTVAFGVRNFENLQRGLSEVLRVLAPGGTLAVLEFSTPSGPVFGRLYRFYFRRVLPRLGRLVSGSSGAYAYLPATVSEFPSPSDFRRILLGEGFEIQAQVPLTFGIVYLHLARRPAARR